MELASKSASILTIAGLRPYSHKLSTKSSISQANATWSPQPGYKRELWPLKKILDQFQLDAWLGRADRQVWTSLKYPVYPNKQNSSYPRITRPLVTNPKSINPPVIHKLAKNYRTFKWNVEPSNTNVLPYGCGSKGLKTTGFGLFVLFTYRFLKVPGIFDPQPHPRSPGASLDGQRVHGSLNVLPNAAAPVSFVEETKITISSNYCQLRSRKKKLHLLQTHRNHPTSHCPAHPSVHCARAQVIT